MLDSAPLGGAADDTGLACLVVLLGFHGLAADAANLRHALGKSGGADAEDLVRLAKDAGARSKLAHVEVDDIARAPAPFIARDKSGDFFLIAGVEDGRILVQSSRGETEFVALEAFKPRWSGEVVFVTTRAHTGVGEAAFDVTWFIPALWRYRDLLRDVLFASFVLQLFALATPFFFQVIIDKVLVHRGLTTLDVLAWGLGAVIVFETVLGGLRAWLFTHTTSRVDVELGAKLYRHVMALPMAYFESRRVGDTVARVRELETVREFLTSSAVTLVIDLCFTIVFLLVLYIYSPVLFLVVLVSLLLYAAISVALTPALHHRIEERFRRGAESQAFLVESVSGVGTLKAAAVEPQMQKRWENLLAAYVTASFRAAKLGIWGSQSIQLVSKLTLLVVLYLGARLVISGDLTVGELVAFNMLAGRVAEPVLRLAQLWQQFQEARVGVARLGDVLNAPIERSQGSRSALPPIEGRITFQDVAFRYRADAPEVLRRVSVNVEPGEVIGIAGPSGSGKSTLTKLVQRLYTPERGRILIDGVDLAMVDPAWLRRQIGVALQENLLFNRTVRENIALADPAMPMSEVVEAAKLAGAHEFILELPEGYDTQIEERGANLSGGQRQRIAIARAIITKPRILLFDEATSALDAESEAIIQRNLAEIAEGRTVLIIAHRLSAIRSADRILTIEAGEITEEGDHEQLLAKGGRYAALWAAQTQVRP
ncbi:MAG: type I secretion system permease/ATPase [Hyphomonadaceae bacterium]|nr:type I secretion system permease/ATPase [Hyphomonadaceae bacterium]